MRLKSLEIKNFRKINELEVEFPPGLSVVVGENNVGKTTIIDALRLLLFPSSDFHSLNLNEDDFSRGTENLPIEVSCIFTDLNENEEAHFHECLVLKGDDAFIAKLSLRAEFNPNTQRANIKMWGGETEGGRLPINLYDKINSIYLQPLRNPEKGLKPSRYSQISRLIDSLTEEEKYEEFEKIISKANSSIRKLESIEAAKNSLDKLMVSIAGDELSQSTELIFSDPSFPNIIAGIQPEIEDLPYSLNGLGYNNLIYTAASLGTLKSNQKLGFRSILIEEPEAHLHPHLQVLLLRYLTNVTQQEENSVQVIASSHSPILASQAPVDSIIPIHEKKGGVRIVSLSELDYDSKMKKKLKRYLDATRSELFFAKRILMVEGISEALLMPILAEKANGNIKESAVTVVNTDGLNFNAFIPLFGKGGLDIPTVILTDGDDKDRTGNPSSTVQNLVESCNDKSNVKVKYGEITFEHELAKSPVILPLMIKAFKELHPNLGDSLESELAQINEPINKADKFLEVFVEKNVLKGQFAQELAGLLEGESIAKDQVPEYIRNAFKFLGVTKEGEANGQ